MSDPVSKSNNQKGVIYTNTAIGFEKLNEEILKSQKEELQAIFSVRTPSSSANNKNQAASEKSVISITE